MKDPRNNPISTRGVRTVISEGQNCMSNGGPSGSRYESGLGPSSVPIAPAGPGGRPAAVRRGRVRRHQPLRPGNGENSRKADECSFF